MSKSVYVFWGSWRGVPNPSSQPKFGSNPSSQANFCQNPSYKCKIPLLMIICKVMHINKLKALIDAIWIRVPSPGLKKISHSAGEHSFSSSPCWHNHMKTNSIICTILVWLTELSNTMFTVPFWNDATHWITFTNNECDSLALSIPIVSSVRSINAAFFGLPGSTWST